MDRKLRVLIVDDNPSFRFVASEELKLRNFEIVGTVGDGQTALQMIETEEPDAVLLDLVIPGIDGIGVLRSVATGELKKRPAFIMSTVMSTDYSMRECSRWGASYYMLKPFDFDILALRITELFNHNNPNSYANEINLKHYQNENMFKTNHRHHTKIICTNDLETDVTRLILDMGVPAHIKGYQFLRSSIIMAIEDCEVVNAVTKVLYPTVARRFSTTPSRVERAIRHAIEVAWERGDIDTLHSIFGYTISNTRGKPTNSEFIALLSDKLRLENKKIV